MSAIEPTNEQLYFIVPPRIALRTSMVCADERVVKRRVAHASRRDRGAGDLDGEDGSRTARGG